MIPKEIVFRVDRTPPEIRSIRGPEENCSDSSGREVSFTVTDTAGLRKVEVFVDGRPVMSETRFPDASCYEGSFHLKESPTEQHMRIVAEDLTGNTMDTDSEEFRPVYAFQNRIPAFGENVQRENLLLRMLGTVTVLSGVLMLCLYRRHRKQRQKKNRENR